MYDSHGCSASLYFQPHFPDVWVRFFSASFFFFFKLPPPLTVAQQVHYVRYHAHTEEKLPGCVSNFHSGEKNS